ncbi:fructose-1,6-bisphosphatase [Candidatus Peregrinibacteria bacterium]|jgi:fructose-1,6-bisphosphatase I|nr:fructose-1,6-bisphosphatase [Candidatus Peregrinibacteria bacterium]MBT7736826.1 fructose-1,6-bisphosphatase [Candidatus Peregrinibacteria bacterium]
MKTFCEYLKSVGVDDELFAILGSLKDATKRIADHIVTADRGKAGSMNIFGEEQLELDVLSDKIIQEECGENPYVGLLASEELPDEIKISDGEYGVCYDPLDGSSLVDVNLAVGSIFGIYKTGSFIGVKGTDMIAAMASVYGPRTTITLTIGDGVAEFVRCEDGDFKLQNDSIKVGEGKMFAPGNLRACAYRDDYMKLTEYWIREEYVLRYSGGMVPDVNQILLKGKGIFSYPGYEKAPDGKLRLLFECAPLSFIMEQAGGASTDGKVRILEKEVESLDQRTPIYIGSKEEVNRCEEYLA